MNNNYKEKHIVTFFVVITLGIIIEHDSYHAFLAIGSAMLAYFFTLGFVNSKIKRILFLSFMSVALTQTSVLVKKAVMEEGFIRVLKNNPIGVIAGDVIYGIQHVIMVISDAYNGVYEAVRLSDYTTIEQMNYRFFSIFVMLVILLPKIIFKKTKVAAA